MNINADTEELETFASARTLFVKVRVISLATLHRWRLHGVRGTKLETCLIGGMRYTSREAIARFIAAQNQGETE